MTYCRGRGVILLQFVGSTIVVLRSEFHVPVVHQNFDRELDPQVVPTKMTVIALLNLSEFE